MASQVDFDDTWTDMEALLDASAEHDTDANTSFITGVFLRSILESFMTLTTSQESLTHQYENPDGKVDLEWSKKLARTFLKLNCNRQNSGRSSGSTHTSTIPTHPKMGELVQQATGTIIRMGGKPLADWSGLESKTETTVEGQYRDLDKTKGPKRVANIPRMKPKWKDTDDLYDLQRFLSSTLTSNGMEQCMHLHNVFDDTKMVDAVTNPHSFVANPEKVTKSMAFIKAEWDDWDSENDNACRNILLESVSTTVRDKISKYYPQSEPFLVLYLRLVSLTKLLTPEAVLAIKNKIKDTKLQDFLGMDVDAAINSLLPLTNDLMDSGDYDPMLIKPFVESFHKAYNTDSEHHGPFWHQIYNEILSPLESSYLKLKATKAIGPHQIEETLILANASTDPDDKPYQGLDRTSIFAKLRRLYNEKKQAFKWEAASAKTDTKAPPASFGAAAVHLAEKSSINTITEAVANALVQNLGSILNKGGKSGSGGNGGKGLIQRRQERW